MVVSSPARQRGALVIRDGCKSKRFEHPAHQIALQEMVEAVRISRERVERLETAIEEFMPTGHSRAVVAALQALRGVDLVVATTFVTESGDIRRAETAAAQMVHEDESVYMPIGTRHRAKFSEKSLSRLATGTTSFVVTTTTLWTPSSATSWLSLATCEPRATGCS